VAFTNDIHIIRKRVADYERHIKRLKYHVDKEDTDSLIKELQQDHMSEMDLTALTSEIGKIGEEVADAKRMKV
jgi:hypothetical protein